MATILSSKTFVVSKDANMPRDKIENWFYTIKRTGDCRLNITLETAGKDRQKKVTARTVLRNLFVGYHDHEISWIKGDYEFGFATETYYWKGKEIYLTANEQLFLYNWLVLKDEIHKRQRFYLRNMRKRLGKEFLAGIAEGGNDNA